MRMQILTIAFAAFCLHAAPALAQSFSGTTGQPQMPDYPPQQIQNMVPSQGQPPETLPPVFHSTGQPPVIPRRAPDVPVVQAAPVIPAVPAAPAVPVAPVLPPATANTAPVEPAAPSASQLPQDPCAAYIASYDAYNVCQNRIKQFDRMKQAKEDRANATKAAREKREAARKAAATPPVKKGFRRPGEVDPPAPAPTPVQVVPPAAPPAGAGVPAVTQ